MKRVRSLSDLLPDRLGAEPDGWCTGPGPEGRSVRTFTIRAHLCRGRDEGMWSSAYHTTGQSTSASTLGYQVAMVVGDHTFGPDPVGRWYKR